jgi:hypothetical protein
MSSWLHRALTPWNNAGGAVPPAAPQAVPGQANCTARERAPRDAAEAQLAEAGWRFLDAWSARIVTVSDPPGVIRVTLSQATSGYDGMCRPTGFNAFVLVDGRFAGTLSPAPMDSGADGALREEPTVLHGGRLEATFTRYAVGDALCCPTVPAARVSYQLLRQPAGWVLLPEAVVRVPALPVRLPRTGARASAPPFGGAVASGPAALATLAAVAGALALAGGVARLRGQIDRRVERGPS